MASKDLPTYYEFFAGGGMARAGLGDEWRCSFANDISAKKGEAYAANWGDEDLWIGDVFKIKTNQLPGSARARRAHGAGAPSRLPVAVGSD